MKNATATAETLTTRGLRIVSDRTESHVMLVDLRTKKIIGKEAERVLDDAYIMVNKNVIPNDPKKPFVASGVRLGSPVVTMRGFKETKVVKIAHLIADVLDDPHDKANIVAVRVKVVELTRQFPVYG